MCGILVSESDKKRPIKDVLGVDNDTDGRPVKKMTTRSARAPIRCSSPGPSTKKAVPSQPVPSRTIRSDEVSATARTSAPNQAKASIRVGFIINDDGAMESEDAIELPPLGGACYYKHAREDGTIVACKTTFKGGFCEKKQIHDHFAAHVSELTKLRDAGGSGAAESKCFQCDKKQGLQTMVRHIETTHFGVQRWDCKHCDNATRKTRMDKSTVERHLEVCLKRNKVEATNTNTNTLKGKGKQAKNNSANKK